MNKFKSDKYQTEVVLFNYHFSYLSIQRLIKKNMEKYDCQFLVSQLISN